jgi:hypothetical protein
MGWVCGPLISGSQTINEQFWERRAVLSFPKKELVLTVLWSSLFPKERTRLDGVMQFSLFQRKNSSSQVLHSSLFIKERTCLDSVAQFSLFQRKNLSWQCCAVLSFSKKGWVSKGQVYIYIYMMNPWLAVLKQSKYLFWSSTDEFLEIIAPKYDHEGSKGTGFQKRTY